ncbi:MAG: 50S ribosomal protein L3 [Desulfobacteraceae bacterium]|nr:50S ribosomal protein L3 [Desulfobacteraceae bacterium]
MSNGLIGKKLGMTGMFLSDGTYVPVTIVEAGPCIVTQIKTKSTDGYDAVQVGFGEKPAARINKPLKGHLKKSGDANCVFLREFNVESPDEYSLGQKITVEMFQVGGLVDVSGVSKGRGFAGVIKRHGFSGGRLTHGSHSQRIPGSIGCSASPSKVIKGKKLPGHYGVDRKTLKNLKIIDIRPEENLLLIKGAIPGAVSGLVEIKQPKTTQKIKK